MRTILDLAKWPLLATGMVALALSVAACGDDDTDDGTTDAAADSGGTEPGDTGPAPPPPPTPDTGGEEGGDPDVVGGGDGDASGEGGGDGDASGDGWTPSDDAGDVWTYDGGDVWWPPSDTWEYDVIHSDGSWHSDDTWDYDGGDAWSPEGGGDVVWTDGGTTEETLFQKLGGLDAIQAFVDTAIPVLAADATIGCFFDGVNVEVLTGSLVDFLCNATGGPCDYLGANMAEAHAGMGISESQFGVFIGGAAAVLGQLGIPADVIGEVGAALTPLAADIVAPLEAQVDDCDA